MKETSSNDNATRTILEDKQYIYYTTKCDGGTDVYSYDSTLLEILKQDCITPTRWDGRLRFRIRVDGSDFTFYAYDIAFAAYQGRVHADSLIEDMKRWLDEKNSDSLTVDHADNNVHNNTRFNLSLMSRELNIKKGSIAKKIKPPYKICSVFMDGVYRIWYGFHLTKEQTNGILQRFSTPMNAEEGCIGALAFECEDAGSYVECLTGLPFIGVEGLPPMRDENNKYRWRSAEVISEITDMYRSLTDEAALANMSAYKFQRFEGWKEDA